MLAVLVLTPLLSVALSVLLVLSILHFLARVPASAVANGVVADPRLLRDIIEPFKQDGTVPVKQYGGIVYYPIPYATPPHLALTAQAPDRSYVIVRQDEFGFVWALDVGLKDVKDLAGALKDAKDLKDVAGALTGAGNKTVAELRPGETFTWEARGVRPFTTAAATPPFVQTGTFSSPGGVIRMEGVEYFPHPYSTSPNVTVSHNFRILATTPVGFRWRNFYQDQAQVTWTARGMRATPEQIDDFAKNPPILGSEPPPVAEDKGQLAFAVGEQGQVSFQRPFMTPPNVEVMNVIVTDITPQGFKWKHPGVKTANNASTQNTQWTAKGVLVPQGQKWSKGK
jgi:hypothetical protein